MSPSVASFRIASRNGVRLTPKSVANFSSVSSISGASLPEIIAFFINE